MLAEPAVPPYVLAGEGSCNDACFRLEAEPVVSGPSGSGTRLEVSLSASAIALSGVAGEPAMSNNSTGGIGMTVAGMLSIGGKESGRAENKI